MHTSTLRINRMQLTARRLFSLERATWRETLVLMIVAWLVPFLVHLIPWAGPRPLGVHLLPAFWTAFVAVYVYGFGVGALVALVVPIVNFCTTGLPALERTGLMTLELVAFVGFAALLVHRWPALRLAAPLAWLPAKILTIAVQWALPAFAYTRSPVEHFVSATTASLAGLGVMLAVNIALVQLLPKDRDWEAE
jgi:hypothetical protein